MADSTVQGDIIRYYSEEFDENARLRDEFSGRLEFLRTQELLRRHLPAPPAEVLDVGGATGVHAEWLAADGHRVHLIDPVARHREQAAAFGTFSVADGDARALAAADGSYDVVLLLGPLYHLPERADRIRALTEARRVLRPGGLLAAAVISRHAPVLGQAALGWINADNEAAFAEELASGVHNTRNGFTTAHLHTLDEFEDEIAGAGFDGALVYGVEGPPILKHLERAGLPIPDRVFDSLLRAARLIERDRSLIAASPHFLAVATRG